MKIGVDLVHLPRIEALILRYESFSERFFSEEETKLFIKRNKDAKFLGGNFAIKEAFSKALGTGFIGFNLEDIEVLRDEWGSPYINLFGRAKDGFEEKGFSEIACSISHDGEYVVGMVVIQ